MLEVMPVVFSYDPTKIGEFGLDRLRFELGDTMVLEPEKTAYLSDEEIIAVLDSSSSWRRAKFRLVETLLRRFSYEVDTEVREAKWSLHQRIDEWKDLWKRLKAELEEEELMGSFGFTGGKSRPPIFRIGMNDYRRCLQK